MEYCSTMENIREYLDVVQKPGGVSLAQKKLIFLFIGLLLDYLTWFEALVGSWILDPDGDVFITFVFERVE